MRVGLAPALRERLARLADSSEKPPALVFECSYVNGLSAIRSLARIGAPVPPLILIGKPMKRKRPLPTSLSRLTKPSMWVKPRSRQT